MRTVIRSAAPPRTPRIRRFVRLLTALAALLASAPPSLAAAQALDVGKFRPSPHSRDLLLVKGTILPSGTKGGGGLLLNYGRNPLVFARNTQQGKQRQAVVTDRVDLSLYGSVSFLDRFSVGLLLPVAVTNEGEGGFTGLLVESGSGIGDIGLSLKGVVTSQEQAGIGVGLALDLKFPTGSADVFLSDDGVGIFPSLILDWSGGGYHVALNAGYNIRSEVNVLDLAVDDEFDVRAALEIPLAFAVPGLSVLGQAVFSTVVDDFFSERGTNFGEIDGAIRYRHPVGVLVQVGGGGGLARGYGNVEVRAFGGAGWEPSLAPPDTDGDGIPDPDDQCPEQPEDLDGHIDGDGCPELDNDADAIEDANDKCPFDPEDNDGFEDEDGCPEWDNDGDGLSDPNDLCPLDPEDPDGYEDEDGCPELDNDEDGVPDDRDKCPTEPETINNYLDEDGCPDAPPKVEVSGRRIVIREKIFFATGKARILSESFPLLDEVAQVLNDHDEILRVQVAGHTDSRGNARRNRTLSLKRAKAVVAYLTGKGVVRDRFEAKGFGPDRPIADNTTKDGRAQNRRVEFTILDVAPR